MKAEKIDRDTYTPQEVADIMGVHIDTIYRYLKAGRIAGTEKFAKNWVIWKGPFDEQRRRDSERKAA